MTLVFDLAFSIHTVASEVKVNSYSNHEKVKWLEIYPLDFQMVLEETCHRLEKVLFLKELNNSCMRPLLSTDISAVLWLSLRKPSLLYARHWQ